MPCSRCNGMGFWCDVCGEAEDDCSCCDDPETGGPNLIECEDCVNGESEE